MFVSRDRHSIGARAPQGVPEAGSKQRRPKRSATRPQALAGTSFDRAVPGPDGASRQVLRQGTFPARFRVLCPINGPAAEEFHFAHISQFGTGFSCGNGVGSFQVVAVSGALKKIEEERSKGDHGEPQVPWDWGSLYQARRRLMMKISVLAAAAAAVLTTSPLIGAIKCHLERNGS